MKFDFRKWTYNGRKLENPLIIIWRIIWVVPVIVSLSIFAAIVAIYDLDHNRFEEIWTDTL